MTLGRSDMKKIKLLTIDDDPYVCEIIRLYGNKEGFDVFAAHDGGSGIERVYTLKPDLIVLDLMLPEIGGFQVCEQIRKDYSIPIVMLTGRAESYDKIKGFDLGADDYVVKPFDPKELMARIKAVLKRTSPGVFHDEMVHMEGFIFDLQQNVVGTGETSIQMPPKEMELLYYLVSHPNRVYTRQQLVDQVWGYTFDGDPRTVDVHIKRIREKLKCHENQGAIQTIRGVGYKFEVTTS